MIDLFTDQDLASLIEQEARYCISIYMPAHRISNGTEQDRIQLKNLLSQAEQQLLESGLDRSAARSLLGPATELLSDENFWQNQEDGLALFLSDADDQARIFRLPLEFDELALVGSRFHVKPLLPMINHQIEFYLLALSQNTARLYAGDEHGLRLMNVDDLPANMEEALWVDDPERRLQFHTETGESTETGTRRAQFHGHAPDVDREQADLLRYCRVVNKAVDAALKGSQKPLIMAAVKELYPVYMEANTYNHLSQSMIAGNPDRETEAKLHGRAMEILQPVIDQQRMDAIEQYHMLANSDRSIKGVEDVVTAAYQARVETLFVAEDAHQWGNISTSTGAIELASESGPDNTDLLDFAVANTISNGGNVFALDQEKMPESDSPIAAILRF